MTIKDVRIDFKDYRLKARVSSLYGNDWCCLLEGTMLDMHVAEIADTKKGYVEVYIPSEIEPVTIFYGAIKDNELMVDDVQCRNDFDQMTWGWTADRGTRDFLLISPGVVTRPVPPKTMQECFTCP